MADCAACGDLGFVRAYQRTDFNEFYFRCDDCSLYAQRGRNSAMPPWAPGLSRLFILDRMDRPDRHTRARPAEVMEHEDRVREKNEYWRRHGSAFPQRSVTRPPNGPGGEPDPPESA